MEQQESLAAMGLSLAMIAHEVNNILTPVRAGAEVALSGPGDAESLRRALQRAADGSARAAAIMQAMLAIAKGSGAPVATACDVRDAIDGALQGTAGGLVASVNVPRGTLVRAHPPLLQHAVMNLVLNAKAAMTSGQGEKRVRFEVARTASGSVEVEVSDNGPGLPPGVARDPFGAPSLDGRRRGLGLLIASHLVHAAGGQITLGSTGPAGTTWVIKLAAAAEVRQAA